MPIGTVLALFGAANPLTWVLIGGVVVTSVVAAQKANKSRK